MTADQIEMFAPLIVVAIALPLILLRNRKPRRLHVDRLWIVPAIVVVGIGMGLTFGRPPNTPFHWLEAVLIPVAAALGAAAGWWRGKLMHIAVDPSDQTVTARASPAGMLFIVALLVLRQVLRTEAEHLTASLPVKPGVVVEALLVFAMATVVAQRVELWIRARRLLAEAVRPAAV